MDGRKLLAIVLAVGVIIGVAAIVWGPANDGGDAEVPTTTTPQSTTTPPGTTATTTTTPPTTTVTTTTTTATPTPNFDATATVSDTEVYAGETTVTVNVTNAGTGGEYTGTITVDRHDGDHYDMSKTVGGYVGPNDEKEFAYLIDFAATGTYTVALDGERVAIVEVYGLSAGGGSGGGGSSGDITPVVNGTVDGGATAG